MTIDEETRLRWRRESEMEARDLMKIRDTLALIDSRDFPKSPKARRAARAVEELVCAIESDFEFELCYCSKCDEGDLDIRFSDRWSIRCKSCDWSVSADTWDQAVILWNKEADE